MEEYKLELDGSISGPVLLNGRHLITHDFFVEDDLSEKEETKLFKLYISLAFKAILKRTLDTITPFYAWNVHTQSIPFLHDNTLGTLYCTFAEISIGDKYEQLLR